MFERKNTALSKDDLDDLDADLLSSQKTKEEVRQLRLEMRDLKMWWLKLGLTVLAPIGSVLLFFGGWFSSHLSDRHRQTEDMYVRAAKQLASLEAPVRLSGVTTLSRFAQPAHRGVFASMSEHLFGADGLRESTSRPAEAMALLIGDLVAESDPSVLEAIERAVLINPIDSVEPLVAANKTAAVQFARAAGDYSGLAVLAVKHAKSFDEDDWPSIEDVSVSDPTISDIVTVVLRTGSPFEATARMNQRFSSRDFLTHLFPCPFHDLFYRQQILSMGSGFNQNLRSKPPDIGDLHIAMTHVVTSAATLERSSFVLAKLASERWDVLTQFDLYGTAVVVGELSEETIAKLRSRGAYYTSSGESRNPGCLIH